MTTFSFVLLFVESPAASANFYEGLLGKPPVEASPTFAMIPLTEGVMLGLWSKGTAEPKPGAVTGASEIAFTVASADEVDTTHTDWAKRGIVILQKPTRMDFGQTFVALDPDGHRIRVLAPE